MVTHLTPLVKNTTQRTTRNLSEEQKPTDTSRPRLERFKLDDASAAGKAAAWSVTNLIKVKSNLGREFRKCQILASKGPPAKKGKGVYLTPYS